MGILIAIVIGLIVLTLALYAFMTTNPADLARQLKFLGGMVCFAVAGVFAISGRWIFAIPIAGLGLSLVGMRGIPGFSSAGKQSAGGQSTVRSAALEMQLDHDSGAMSGRVLAGTFEGRGLDDLDQSDLVQFYADIVGDGESRALLEAYLDRRFAGWREDVDDDPTAGQGSTTGAGPMTHEEAHQVLGLAAGASEADVLAAHRRLMKSVHPDHGGSTFLAAKINEAKDRLLGKHN